MKKVYAHIDGRTADDIDDLLPPGLSENERFEYAVRYIILAEGDEEDGE